MVAGRHGDGCAWPLVAAAGAGAITLQLALTLSPESGVWPATLITARVVVLAGALVALADAGMAMVRGGAKAEPSPKSEVRSLKSGDVPTSSSALRRALCRQKVRPGLPSLAPPGAGPGRRMEPGHIVVGAMVVLAALLWRHPGRLVLNEVGFALTAAPLAWVVARRAGRGAAVEAALGLAALALAATFADVRRPLSTEEWQPDSRFRWAAGWPAGDWVLRHEIALDRPAEARAMVFSAPLTRDYAGPARVLVRVNGHDLGAASIGGHTLEVDLPPAVVAGQTRLTFELRTSEPDPNLRLTAFRVTRGSTLGSQASSYYDSAAQRWFPGTFNDALGRPQPGIYVVELKVRS